MDEERIHKSYDEQLKETFEAINKQFRMVKKIRKKIAELEKVFQEGIPYGIGGKVTVSVQQTVIKIEEKIVY